MGKSKLFITLFATLPSAAIAEDAKVKTFLILHPSQTHGEVVVRNPPKTISDAPRVSIEIKKDKAHKSDPEADAPAEIKTEVKPVDASEKTDDEDF